MSFTTLQANNQYVLQHANPMPNLMRIAIQNASILEIDDKQMASLKTWVKKNKPVMQEMVKKVMSEEKMLHEKALDTDTDTTKEVEAMLETRKNIIAIKANCRVTLKSILTPKQYANVITIYKSAQ
jgi:hypothetical protein